MMRMTKEEPENWTKLAKTHVIRRSYSRWSGIATDLIIEQVLMCSLKSIGGLSHGRGWSEAQQLSWLLSRPTCAEYNHSIQKLTSVSFLSSDQHTPTHSWSTGARMTRDKQDVDKLTTFFTTYDPFSPDPTLHCIATGVVASTSANVDDAQSIGVKILDDMVDQEVNQYTFPVSSKAKTLAARPEIEVNGEKVSVNPQLLFQRLSVATSTQTDEARQEAFSYELCSYPPALFDHKLFQRSGAKSELADAIWRQVDLEHIEKPAVVFPQRGTNDISTSEAHVTTRQIIDGGSLLHRIPWSKCHMTWIQLIDIYVHYVIRVYGPDSIVVFDDYPTHPTTKDEAHMRRSGTAPIISIQVQEDHLISVNKKLFMSKKENVKQFISLLSYHLTARGVTCHHAVADADRLIAKVAIESATESSTVVNAEDTDVLILLLHMTPDNTKDIFFVPHIPKQRTKKRRVWPIQDVQRRLGRELCQRLLFIHAFSGCDTTARPYGMGKGTTLSKVMNNLILGKCADTFTDVNSTKEDVIEAGDLAMRLLTGGNGTETLAVQRYKEFKTKVLKGNVLVKAETLTATSGSTKQHSLRTYHQVMAWLGLDLPPDKYGFRILDGKYRAIFTELAAAPDALLKSFFCNCKTDCNTSRCTCRKYNLPCTDMCGVCQGLGCRNTEPPSMTNWMFHMLWWCWQSLFLLTDLEYHINFAYTNIIETWLFCELYHLACVQIIGISQKFSGLESPQFWTFSVALDWHWHILDILYINIIRYLLLYFNKLCVRITTEVTYWWSKSLNRNWFIIFCQQIQLLNGVILDFVN